MRRKLIAGNWKMNGSGSFIESYADTIKSDLSAAEKIEADIAIFTPFLYLAQSLQAFAGSDVIVGAQNVAEYDEGAYTGEVSAAMLADIGCQWALVGHSERRSLYGETDESVLAKIVAAQAAGINTILCVGETLEERESGLVDEVIKRQVGAVFNALSTEQLATVVIAYEPVWAIGTGKTATPEQAQEVHQLIRDIVSEVDADLADKLRILYGGSVKPENAAEIFSKPDVDGGLVGGASLSAEGFFKIINAAGH
jgi:triosephosphate isomerase